MNPETRLRADIHTALDGIGGLTPDLAPAIIERLHAPARPRRLLALTQGLLVIGLATIVGVVVLATHRPPITHGPITSPTSPIVAGPAASIAWVSTYTASSSEGVIGIDQTGRVVGRIDAAVDMRSADGAHLYALGMNEVDVYSALDGHQEATIRLQKVTAPGIEILSRDGRYLAVSGGTSAVVELVDLTSNRSLAAVPIGSAYAGVPIIVGNQAQSIYVVGDTVAKLAFDGSTLRVVARTANPFSCAGLAIGGENSGGGLPFRVLADGRTLVAFCPGDGRITWFDLVQMTVVKEITHGQANPFWVSPVFSPDGNTLYLHEGGTGALAAVDLVNRRIDKSTRVAMAATNPLARLESILVTPAYAGGIPRTAAVSPDGSWLYAVGIFDAPGGISVVHLPDLTVKGRWLPTTSFDSVWVSADGETIYLVTQSSGVLRLVRPDGTQITQLTLPGMADGFLVPTLAG